MMLRYVDTHCHLAARHFSRDVEQVITRCREAGVTMLAVAADLASSRANLDLAAHHDGVFASAGVHPCDCGSLDETGWQEVVAMAGQEPVVAVGETGLDYYWRDTPHDVQRYWFEQHIRLSLATGKPLSIHARDSVRDMLDMIEPYFDQGLRAVWHCFVAGKKDIDHALDFAIAHGLYLAVGGLVTFEDQRPLRSRIPSVPDDLLLLETDAPYLVPRPKTRQRNEPDGVIRVAEVVAELRGATVDHITDITTQNAKALFGI